MANTTLGPKGTESSEWCLVKPMVSSRRMTTWKSGLKFQPEVGEDSAGADIGTPSRRRKKGIPLKKGSFQKKNRVADAPNLLSVVSATPEMKERAKADAKARQIKIEEYRKFKSSRTIVKKQPLKQPRSQWQNMITNTDHGKKSKSSKFAVNKKKSMSTGDIAIADWKAAYQDILSPTSGSRRFVARRDLTAAEKVTSPKKKTRAKARSASADLFAKTLPLIGNDDDEKSKDNPLNCGNSEDTSPLSKDSSKKTPLAIDLSKYDDESTTRTASSIAPSNRSPNGTSTKLPVVVSPIYEKAEHELETVEKDDLNKMLRSKKLIDEPYLTLDMDDEARNDLKDGFVDFDDFDDATETMDVDETDGANVTKEPTTELKEESTKLDDRSTPMHLHGSMHTAKVTIEDAQPPSPGTVSEAGPAKAIPRTTKSKTLILEFSMPALSGGVQTGDDYDVGLEVPVDVFSYGDISSVGSWPSIESEDSYETRMNKMMQRWMDVNGGDENEYFDNEVQLDDNVLDHIVLAAPDLERAMEQFHDMTGIMPTHVGPLQGLGAKTAHVGLDNNRYIEILAADKEDPGPLGDELKRLKEDTLIPYHYAIRSSEVSRLIEGYVYDVLGWDPDHIAMVQALPDDTVRQWDLLTMYGHDMGGVAPYYVRWANPTQHPTAKIASDATLLSCRVVAPEDHDVHKLITGVGGIDIGKGDPMLECMIETPKGTVTFSATTPRGLVFPGYDDEYA
ncbi:glyoxalase-like protein [Nitzschia inconspicua]|uniref:Glyoxalase-like protein n=1 Tax=Nitzschia inconspicua TaxID=303405 RepID=A0A9K3LVN0_9STRA|nr:glyoxalase-like protein [Nitzschia inconspicua]